MLTRIKNLFGSKRIVRKPIRRSPVRLQLEALEARDCPSTTSWISHGPGDWSNPSCWDNGVPAAGDTAVFDAATKSYYNCTIDVNTANVNVVIQNGYSAEFMINPGCTWNINNFTDNNPSEDSFDVQYQSSGSSGGAMVWNGTSQFYNIGISDTGSNGALTISSTANITIGEGSGYNINLYGPITSYGTVFIGDSKGLGALSMVNFTEADEIINVPGGTMHVNGAGNSDSTIVQSNGALFEVP